MMGLFFVNCELRCGALVLFATLACLAFARLFHFSCHSGFARALPFLSEKVNSLVPEVRLFGTGIAETLA